MIVKVNKRLIEIFGLLIQEKRISIKDLCMKLNLNERSVRYEIDNINYILRFNGLDEIKKMEKGMLQLDTVEKAKGILDGFTDIARLSKEDRMNYIYINLLMNGRINISKATKELEVSRTTVKSDLKEIECELNNEDIHLIENKLVASEHKIRSLALKRYCVKISELYYCTSFNEYDKCSIEYYICLSLTKAKLNFIKDYVDFLSKKFNNNEQQFYEVIFSYLIISYIRIANGYVLGDVENKEFLISTNEYKYLKDTINSLESTVEVKFNTMELLLLADYLLGLTSYTYNTKIFKNWVDIKMVIKEIIYQVDSKTSSDIRNDDILLSGLLNHIKPMVYRTKNGLSIEKELYFQSIEENFELYKVVKESLKLLEDLINVKFNDAEVALFTIHFLAAIRRNEDNVIKFKKILLVCGGGYGTSAIVKNILEENYNVSIVESISYYQLLKYDMRNIDLVVSTINIATEIRNKISKPLVLVTPFFTFQDDKILQKYNITRKKNEDYKIEKILDIVQANSVITDTLKLRKDLENLFYKRKKVINKAPETLFELLKEDKVEILDRLGSWKDALNICGDKLIKSNEIKQEYMDDIFKVIETFGAYFVLSNQIAIPHGQFNVNVNNSCMSVMYIREGVLFPGELMVKLVILIASSEKNIIIKTVEKINKISQNKRLYEELKRVKSKSDLIEYLNRGE